MTKNPFSKNEMYCPACGSGDLKNTSEEMYCKECGLIIDEEEKFY